MKENHKCALIPLAISCALAVNHAAGQSETDATALTIYSAARPGSIPPELYRDGGRGAAIPGYAVIRQERGFNLNRGRNTVRFADVAALIDPTTVTFESLTDAAGTSVVEQNFQFDLVSQEKLLAKYVDQPVKVDQVRGNSVESFSGTLLSTAGGLILRRDDGSVQILPQNTGITLPNLPGGLITRPTLVWDVNARQPGVHRTRVSYQTTGIAWWTDYNLIYNEGSNPNACKLDVGAWVSIINQSGASYPEAKLKLIAGDVQRAPAPGRPQPAALGRSMAMEQKVAGFEEKEFFEYHLYTLGRATTLPDNSTKQIELFPAARGVTCEKTLVYYGLSQIPYRYGATPLTDRNYGVQSSRKVDVYLGFRNAPEHNMGMPLPAGRIRVSKLDSNDKTLEFIGEDVIDHTPRNEKVLIRLGSAFDVVGERRQVDFKVDTVRKTMSEEIEVRLRNQKKEPVTVIVKENLYRWMNWQITAATHDFQKQDARTVHFPVKIAAGAELTLRYSAQYSW